MEKELKKKETENTFDAKLVERFGEDRLKKVKGMFAPRHLTVIEVDGKFALLQPVTASAVSQFSMLVANPQAGLEKASRYLLDTLWIDGDEEIRSNDDYFIPAMLKLQEVIELKKSTIWKL